MPLEEIAKKIDSVIETQARILGYLENDPFTNTPGLVQRVRTVESEVQELKRNAQKKKGIHISFAYLGGALKLALAAGKALFIPR